ncbi:MULTISPECIES: FecR family protein [unclassified Imperialibacter]|uniref:FecR family protein n=1 Tax=unclassified Imperialibacter TaxID=2629706 RepID=UPI001252CE5C|nr:MULTISPECIES: FecR domain-containing protein [unclassified Imperialibacter]CAD5279122.1 putative Iron dicitrate transport regulator FecR [Imperialibacter sp. 89]CAD5293189.1 putative Iron dicitrate transport regulator FecR [Imperialibacter sp. 75]VVS99045.1 putative Iron dicitrate transport regulator FecR [Imperialibacter sp. EC-SDR9]
MNPTFNTVEDLIVDNSFRKWVLQNDPKAKAHWQLYLSANPEKKELVEEAKTFLKKLPRVNYQLPTSDFETIWAQIEKTSESDIYNHGETMASAPTGGRVRPISSKWYYLAASIALILIAVGISQQYTELIGNTTVSFQTKYGENQTIELPDGSVVTLNANSTLTYQADGFSNDIRKVEIDGEAFFKISKHTSPKGDRIKFTVETADLEVEVLGTEFNVNTRRASTKVVLTEGQVQVKLTKIDSVRRISMVPGEKITYTSGQKSATKEQAKVNVATAWKQNELIFENTPVGEIIHVLEDNYGLRIKLKKPGIAEKHYTGTFKNPDPEVILMALSGLFDLKLERHNGTVTLN